jgi:hypothetical protein
MGIADQQCAATWHVTDIIWDRSPDFRPAGTALGFGANTLANQFQPENEQARKKRLAAMNAAQGNIGLRLRFGVGLLAGRLGPLSRRHMTAAEIKKPRRPSRTGAKDHASEISNRSARSRPTTGISGASYTVLFAII